jgi:hypothetical protein
MLKKQGTFPTGERGGEKCAIFAFKAYQLRVYGGYIPGRDREFLCTEIEVAKKRDRANRLKRSAKLLGEIARQMREEQ